MIRDRLDELAKKCNFQQSIHVMVSYHVSPQFGWLSVGCHSWRWTSTSRLHFCCCTLELSHTGGSTQSSSLCRLDHLWGEACTWPTWSQVMFMPVPWLCWSYALNLLLKDA